MPARKKARTRVDRLCNLHAVEIPRIGMTSKLRAASFLAVGDSTPRHQGAWSRENGQYAGRAEPRLVQGGWGDGMNDLEAEEHVSLCEALDRVLNTGVVVAGEVVISVADVDLIYLGLQVMLSSVETARGMSLPAGRHVVHTARSRQ
jgi:hypothetical protein